MTITHAPDPGSVRVCAMPTPGHVIAMSAPDVETAQEIRSFVLTSNILAAKHGYASEMNTDVSVERFDGAQWVQILPLDPNPWLVISDGGTFRFSTRDMAERFSAPADVVSFEPERGFDPDRDSYEPARQR